MKRMVTLLLCIAVFASLIGCTAAPGSPQAYTLEFFYRQSEPELGADNGILGVESHTFGADVPSFDEIFTAYFAAPQDAALSSPFPKALKAMGTSLDASVLTVTLSEQFSKLSGVGYSTAVACIAKTMLQIAGVDAVCLEYPSGDGTMKQTQPVTQADIVCRDLGAFNSETAVRLYFADPNGRYLVAEDRKNVFTDTAQIPSYIVQQLIAGPSEEGLLAVMPEGTRLLDLAIDDDGLCSVNFSSEFRYNRPSTELMERMCIYAVVNALTELEQIQSVRFLVDGNPLGKYLYMDLSAAFTRDESAKSVVRMGLNEFDATLYVRSWSDSQLAAVPVCVRRMASSTQAEDLLRELLNFESRNGLASPIPAGTSILSMEEQSGVCKIDLSRDFLQCAGKQADELLAIRSIAASLCSIDGIKSVRISVGGKSEGLQYCDLMQPLIPNEKWFFE